MIHGTRRLEGRTGRVYTRRDKKGRAKAIRTAKVPSSLIFDPWPSMQAKLDVEHLLNKLPLLERTVVMLVYLHGYTHREVAQAVNLNRSTVSGVIERALGLMLKLA